MAGIESLVSGIAGALGGGGGLGGLLKGAGGAGGHDHASHLAGLMGGGGGAGAGSGLGGILGKLGEMAMGFFSSIMGALKGGAGGSPLGDAKLGAQALSGKSTPSKVSVEQGAEVAVPPPPGAAPSAAGNAAQTSAGKAFPVEGGKVIGHPHQGTHTLGNWQSDNALDIAAPEGTPIYAPSDGVVTKAKGSNDDPSSRFNGFNLELESPDNAWFMQHMSEMLVKDGDHVKQGQMIGRVGSANNNSHLHIGQREGSPDTTFAMGDPAIRV